MGIFLQAVMAVWRDWQRCIRNILMVRRKIRDINMEFNAHYVREDLDEKSKRSCPM